MARKDVGFPTISDTPARVAEINKLRDLSMPELLHEYHRVFGKKPRVKHRAYLWKRIAWKLEEIRTGGLSMVAKARLEELISQLGIDFSKPTEGNEASRTKALDLTPGTSLTREYKGNLIAVRVLTKGFEFKGETFRSLSAVAKAATGQHCNGRAFFGLKAGKAKQ